MSLNIRWFVLVSLIFALSAPLARADDEGEKSKDQEKGQVPPGLQKKGGMPPGQAKKKGKKEGKKGGKQQDEESPTKPDSPTKGTQDQPTRPPGGVSKSPEPAKPADKPSQPASSQTKAPAPSKPVPSATTPPATGTAPAKPGATAPAKAGSPTSKAGPDKKIDFDRGVTDLNKTASSASTSQQKSLTVRAARSLGLSDAAWGAQAKAHPALGLGDLYVANAISKTSKTPAEALIAQNKAGKSWGTIAEENKADLTKILDRVSQLNKTAHSK